MAAILENIRTNTQNCLSISLHETAQDTPTTSPRSRRFTEVLITQSRFSNRGLQSQLLGVCKTQSVS